MYGGGIMFALVHPLLLLFSENDTYFFTATDCGYTNNYDFWVNPWIPFPSITSSMTIFALISTSFYNVWDVATLIS